MDRTHREQLSDICMDDIDWMDNLTYVSEAIAMAEREREMAASRAVSHAAFSESPCHKIQRREDAVSHLFHL